MPEGSLSKAYHTALCLALHLGAVITYKAKQCKNWQQIVKKITCLHCESSNKRVLPVGPQLEPWATPVFTTLCLFVNDYEIVRIDLAIRNKFEVK